MGVPPVVSAVVSVGATTLDPRRAPVLPPSPEQRVRTVPTPNRPEEPMAGPAPIPQVIVRGEAVLTVEPELAVVEVTVRARGRDRGTALQRCSARQAEVNEAVISAGGGGEAAGMAPARGQPGHRAGAAGRGPGRRPPGPAVLGGVRCGVDRAARGARRRDLRRGPSSRGRPGHDGTV